MYGGGGITPDYIVKSEPISVYTQNLLRKNLFYTYILSYLDKNNGTIKQKYSGMKSFKDNFKISDSFLNSFIDYAKSKEVEFVEKDFNEDKEYIAARLKAQIARNYWKNEGWFSILLTTDEQMNKALTLFDEAKKIAELN